MSRTKIRSRRRTSVCSSDDVIGYQWVISPCRLVADPAVLLLTQDLFAQLLVPITEPACSGRPTAPTSFSLVFAAAGGTFARLWDVSGAAAATQIDAGHERSRSTSSQTPST